MLTLQFSFSTKKIDVSPSCRSLLAKMNSIQVNTKELVRFNSGCHGNLLAVEVKKVVGAYCPKKPSWQ